MSSFNIRVNGSYLSYYNNVGFYFSDSQVEAYRFTHYWEAVFVKQAIQCQQQREQVSIFRAGRGFK